MGTLEGGMIYQLDDRDYLLGDSSDLIEEIKKRGKENTSIIEYNQLDLENGKNSCTINAAIGAVSDLMDYKFTDKERQSILDEAIRLGLDIEKGWYFNKAVNLVYKWWNANKKEKIMYFTINQSEQAFLEALRYNHSLVGGYKGNAEYNRQASTGEVSGEDFKPSSYGHCIRLRNEVITVVDNYKGYKKLNTYTIKQFQKLIDNKVYYPDFYIFLKKDIMSPEAQELAEAIALGIYNGQNSDAPASRSEVARMVLRGYKLSQK